MRNSIIALGTLALLAMIVPMLALPVFAVRGADGGIGVDAPKTGTATDGGSNVISHHSGGQHQNTNGLNAPRCPPGTDCG